MNAFRPKKPWGIYGWTKAILVNWGVALKITKKKSNFQDTNQEASECFEVKLKKNERTSSTLVLSKMMVLFMEEKLVFWSQLD